MQVNMKNKHMQIKNGHKFILGDSQALIAQCLIKIKIPLYFLYFCIFCCVRNSLLYWRGLCVTKNVNLLCAERKNIAAGH